MTITNTIPNAITNTIPNTMQNTQEEKKTNTTPVVKNKTNKNKVVHPRNPLSYSFVRHSIILGQD